MGSGVECFCISVALSMPIEKLWAPWNAIARIRRGVVMLKGSGWRRWGVWELDKVSVQSKLRLWTCGPDPNSVQQGLPMSIFNLRAQALKPRNWIVLIFVLGHKGSAILRRPRLHIGRQLCNNQTQLRPVKGVHRSCVYVCGHVGEGVYFPSLHSLRHSIERKSWLGPWVTVELPVHGTCAHFPRVVCTHSATSRRHVRVRRRTKRPSGAVSDYSPLAKALA
jgi:hypothetical protein